MLGDAVFVEAGVLVVEELVLEEATELLVEVVVGAANQLPGESAIAAASEFARAISDGDLGILRLRVVAADAAAEVGLELVESESEKEIPHERATVKLGTGVEVGVFPIDLRV